LFKQYLNQQQSPNDFISRAAVQIHFSFNILINPKM